MSRSSDCAGPVGPPGVLTCARGPPANRRRPLLHSLTFSRSFWVRTGSPRSSPALRRSGCEHRYCSRPRGGRSGGPSGQLLAEIDRHSLFKMSRSVRSRSFARRSREISAAGSGAGCGGRRRYRVPKRYRHRRTGAQSTATPSGAGTGSSPAMLASPCCRPRPGPTGGLPQSQCRRQFASTDQRVCRLSRPRGRSR